MSRLAIPAIGAATGERLGDLLTTGPMPERVAPERVTPEWVTPEWVTLPRRTRTMPALQPLARLVTLITALRLRLRGTPAGRRFFVHGGRFAHIAGRGSLHVGPGVNLSCGPAPVRIEVTEGAVLTLGERSFLNAGVEVICHHEITIGAHCRLAPNCVLTDTNHHPVHEGGVVRRAPVRLGRNVWLGRGVIVLPGVTIGDNAVVAAGSVVFNDIPANQVWRGNPASFVKPVRGSDHFVRP